jgi:hypothetical protein
VVEHEAPRNDPNGRAILTEIMHLVDMQPGVPADGWTRETARLFALDTVLMVARRNMLVFTEADRQSLAFQLQEARSLVVSGRDGELGFVQAALEAHLSLAAPGRSRRLWLAAIDALIPSPYRAALVSTTNALALGTTEALADLSKLLRDRLLARLGEGSLLTDPPSLFLTA